MGAVCELGTRINLVCLSKFFFQNVRLPRRFKRFRVEKFSEVLNSNTKPDQFSNHLLKITFYILNSVRKPLLNCLQLNAPGL